MNYEMTSIHHQEETVKKANPIMSSPELWKHTRTHTSEENLKDR